MTPFWYPGITYVVPCSRQKLDRPAPARELYVGKMFRHTFVNAERSAAADTAAGCGPARVLILSGKYGLIDPDTVIEPYDLKMGAPGSITVETLAEQALEHGIDWGPFRPTEVYALLPKEYFRRLDAALRTHDVYVQDVYEGTASIGEQRRVNALAGATGLGTAGRALAGLGGDGDGLRVWLGADVNGFNWGVPILVSYGRLRTAKVLPVACAPWVLDSRGFAEVAQFGRWTIPVEEYIADIRRFQVEIGRLEWVAPQDWPASARLLAVTGLTEAEHQARTTQSVLDMRAAAPDVPTIAVVTGVDVAGYLEHVDMYLAAGVDLAVEQLPVGVGALVGRQPKEVAEIVAALHARGLQNLHGFGVKGPALNLCGRSFTSTDSSKWSLEARYLAEPRCPHGLAEYETNCPVAAVLWAQEQRERAAASPPPQASTAVVQPRLFATV